MPEVNCVGLDGVTRQFFYSIEEDNLDHVWRCQVVAVRAVPAAPAFEMIFEPLGDNAVRQTGIFHHGVAAHRAKGIPDALLPIVANTLQRRVCSSPAQGGGVGVFRTVDAEKMWARLRANGIAEYDANEQIYFIDPLMAEPEEPAAEAAAPAGEAKAEEEGSKEEE